MGVTPDTTVLLARFILKEIKRVPLDTTVNSLEPLLSRLRQAATPLELEIQLLSSANLEHTTLIGE